MRWRTAHKRRKRQKLGPQFPVVDMKRFIICNRFAASADGGLRLSPGRYFRSAFYALKDRLMDKYGKSAGYARQYWTSGWYDYNLEDFIPDACHHYHILERVKIGGRIYHRPTGHFYFSNDATEYFKKSVGFDLMESLCVERLKGKKKIIRNVPAKAQALAALDRLMHRYGHHLSLPERSHEPVRVISGDYFNDHWQQQQSMAKAAPATPVQCHFCLKESADVRRVDGHELCTDCRSRVLQMANDLTF